MRCVQRRGNEVSQRSIVVHGSLSAHSASVLHTAPFTQPRVRSQY
jgi:hypothetical protein